MEPLPAVPTHLATCFNRTVNLPDQGASGWTASQVVEIIANLRKSELRKNSCGRQLLAFYEGVKNSYD